MAKPINIKNVPQVDDFSQVEELSYELINGKRVARKSSEAHVSNLYTGDKKDGIGAAATNEGLTVTGVVKSTEHAENDDELVRKGEADADYVAKEDGKGLPDNNYSDIDKSKVDNTPSDTNAELLAIDTKADDNSDEIVILQNSQTSGDISRLSRDDEGDGRSSLPRPGVVDVRYFVLDDFVSSRNGAYLWNAASVDYDFTGSGVNGTFEPGNIEAISGDAAYKGVRDELNNISRIQLEGVNSDGYYASDDGTFVPTTEWDSVLYEIPENSQKLILSGSTRPPLTALAIFFNESDAFISSDFIGDGTSEIYTDQDVEMPVGAAKVAVVALSTEDNPIAKSDVYVEKYVGVDEQGFNDSEKAQARENIEALGEDALYGKSEKNIEGAIEDGYYASDDGVFSSTVEWNSIKVNIPEGALSLVLSGSTRPSLTALAVFFGDADNFISSSFIGSGSLIVYTDEEVSIPINASKVAVVSLSSEDLPIAKYSFEELNKVVATSEQSLSSLEKSQARQNIDIINPWDSKRLYWCGTSIPAGSNTGGDYPSIVGDKLGATVNNEAIASSMIRANVRTGDYVSSAWVNIKNCMSKTLEEVQDLIDNWDTYRLVMNPVETTTPMSETDQLYCTQSSFETILTPYLDGTNEMPDLFVMDHGHNDYKYTLSGGGSDIGLEPTVANIQSGELAEDTFMTANNNAKLAEFLGSLDNIDPSDMGAFIASVNRNCFIGAMNFMMTYILTKNPRARFAMVSNYEDWSQYSPLIAAQQSISDEWLLPICDVYKRLGYSNRIVPGTSNYWGDSRIYDLNVYDIYLKDAVHPHSDTTGQANEIYAAVLSEFLTGCS